jgi:hypothetical protein
VRWLRALRCLPLSHTVQVWIPDSTNGSRKPTPTSCPPTSVCAMQHVHPPHKIQF